LPLARPPVWFCPPFRRRTLRRVPWWKLRKSEIQGRKRESVKVRERERESGEVSPSPGDRRQSRHVGRRREI
jgi:hypothetical protein